MSDNATALDALYAASTGILASATSVSMFTIVPRWCSSTGTKALMTFRVPKKFVSISSRTALSGTSAGPPTVSVAALLIQNDHGRSWLLALRNPNVARALAVMHADPGGVWTPARLAPESNLSRATLVRRFTALVGEPPLAYLTRWRMELAARQLRETDDAVGAIARRVGYTSEFAFSRAFARLRGRPPGRYRIEVKRNNQDHRA